MIETIDIVRLGSYRNFIWKNSVRDGGNNVAKFKKLNVLYGRNYAGKTTLSRVFRSLETRELPKRFDDVSFVVHCADGVVKSSEIQQANVDVRVYNKDFVDENLSFLREDNGKIAPFAILGEANADISKQIRSLEEELGNVENQSGSRYAFHLKKSEVINLGKDIQAKKYELERLFTEKANKAPSGIKHNPLYKDPNYDSKKLKADIAKVRLAAAPILAEQDLADLVAVLKEAPLPRIENIEVPKLIFDTLLSEVNAILTKRISPTYPIQEMLNDVLLQSWVKDGIGLHKGRRTDCGFCGNPIPADLWIRLGNHFNKESDDLQKSIFGVEAAILREKNTLKTVPEADLGEFYHSLRPEVASIVESLKFQLVVYERNLSTLLDALHERRSDIFSTKDLPILVNNGAYVHQLIGLLNECIDKNAAKTLTLEAEQLAARERVRLSNVAHFIFEIQLDEKLAEIRQLEESETTLKGTLIELEVEGKKKARLIEELQAKLRDEKKGAEQVNKFLSQFFGHGGMRLEAVPSERDQKVFEFQIFRGDSAAYNLSEGECSLLAFCYFMAKLKDIDSAGKDKIIYIDDPISSLDSNHIFFIYSLIESVLARPLRDLDGNIEKDANGASVYPYKQIFISTHNLEFLKYLKRITRPPKNHENFLITSEVEGSKISLMPEYLRRYVTELNYLFGEIVACTRQASDKNYHCFYNFGNNLRKFLEAYLFFKYPFSVDESKDYDARIRLFFSGGSVEEILIQRLTNEFSHLGEAIDRGSVPVDCPEISRIAGFVLRQLKRNDAEQYRYFLSSVDECDPIEEAG